MLHLYSTAWHSSLADDTGIIEELVEEMSCSANLYANKSYELRYKGYWLAKFLFSDDRALISLSSLIQMGMILRSCISRHCIAC